MDDALISAEGLNGVVTLYSDRVRIRRKGGGSFFTHGLTGDKDIRLASISSVQLKPAGRLTGGYIQFAFFGGTESKGGILRATSDENTVMFNRKQTPGFEALRDAVQERMSRNDARGSDWLQELEKLADLRDRGILTNEEFKRKKQQLLGS